MLLDPFVEQLHLPAASADLGDDYRGFGHVVGQERELFAGFRIGMPSLSFENLLVENIHIVNLAVGNNDKGWEVPLQFQKREQFDGRFGPSKL